MGDTLQDVYAKHMQQCYGYPLRIPEPNPTLPEDYQDEGFQVGDVGIVDATGRFHVLFNICKGQHNVLHKKGVPDNFQPTTLDIANDVSVTRNAISPGFLSSPKIKQILHSDKSRPVDYEFNSTSSAGAILILPYGATSYELKTKERFRTVATGNALDWYEFAKKLYGGDVPDSSLYLITGLYKTSSWSLGSFSNPPDVTGKILARKDEKHTSLNLYLLEFEFHAYPRHGPTDNADDAGRFNQTVFITGFKITARGWGQDPIVHSITQPQSVWLMLLLDLLGLFTGFFSWWRRTPNGLRQNDDPIHMVHNPRLSQPFHPSDAINRFLLSKSPNARFAITHDSQWMDMMKEGLTHEDLLQEDRLGAFITRSYTLSVDSEHGDTAVFLQRNIDGTTDRVSSIVDPYAASHDLEMSDTISEAEASPPPTPDVEISPSTTPSLEMSSPTTSELDFSRPPTPSLDDSRIIITRVRAQNIPSGLKRTPVGLYVSVQFDGAQRRTSNKPIRLNDNSIEWEDRILLPSEAFHKVRFMVHASFELEPMLGKGEILFTSESRVEELVGGTHLITFSQGESRTAAPDPSLLITLGRWYSNHLAGVKSGDDSNLDLEESSDLVRETDSGNEALLRYYDEYQREDLESALRHFKCAWTSCPLMPRCRAVVLVNLAKAKLISYLVNPTSDNLDESIALYREALNLRPPGHPDRPATLLQLAQALLFRYARQGCKGSVAEEINELIGAAKLQDPSEGSHEGRAADLVLETLRRCRTLNSGSLDELDGLVRTLKQSAMIPPDGYFDRPQRLINLCSALWRRYEIRGGLSDLQDSMDRSNQALDLLPGRHPDRVSCLKILDAALWRLFELHGDLCDLEKSIAVAEEALQLIPEGHPERPYWAAKSLTNYHAEMSERLGDTAFEAGRYNEAIEQYSLAIILRSTPSTSHTSTDNSTRGHGSG